MKARWLLMAAAVILLAGLLWALRQVFSGPPEVPFAVVKRETLVSTLASNGKVEPLEFAVVRTEHEGLLQRVLVKRGQRVTRGTLLAQLGTGRERTELAAAEARLQQARAALEILRRGGPAAELAELDSALARAHLDLARLERECRVLEKLVEKQAAAPHELEVARDHLAQVRAEIHGLENKRRALVSPPEIAAAEARLKEAQAARDQAFQRLQQSQIRAPLNGVVYELRVRRGDYLNPGDALAAIGELDPVRVRIYVDEPELGRLKAGMPVTITWDALPGRSWEGRIEQTPLQVTALGTRQVGEVLLTIRNPAGDLLPGANVNAEIRTQVINTGLVIPKEAVRRESQGTGVFVLEAADRIAWRVVKLGASTLTRTQVMEGLREGERVALTSQHRLRQGLRIRPVFP